MKKKNVDLPEQQLEALQRVSEESGRPVAELIRQAIHEFLLRQQQVRPTTESEQRQ